MSLKTKIIIVLGGLLLAGGLFIGKKIHKEIIKPTVVVKEVKNQAGEEIIEVKEPKETIIEKELPMDMNEIDFQQTIHNMSHQKVLAEEKRGAEPLTHDRVLRLIKIAEKSHYLNKNDYLGILKRWEANDFSNADNDHNIIWNLQDGTVGRASGVMSPEQERQYIDENFKN
ncbi:DUF6241 domain-containing protein [Bacillus salipaludis]|uniref:DUF6241 domain-containing protein n=1 Tax=Bacillus salipaludis TaxID=2547811 RepID=UPI002E20E787|nr:DUF6241 domain-containing protein [Bacillus salipaludis]